MQALEIHVLRPEDRAAALRGREHDAVRHRDAVIDRKPRRREGRGPIKVDHLPLLHDGYGPERLVIAALLRDALKYLEKNIPDLQKMAVAYLLVGRNADGAGGGSADELRDQIVDVALDRAFLADVLPTDAAQFTRRIEEGRGRLTLIASEIARSASAILLEHTAALRKLKDARAPKEVIDDVSAQLARLVTFAMRGFKETASNGRDMRRLIALQVSLLLAALGVDDAGSA